MRKSLSFLLVVGLTLGLGTAPAAAKKDKVDKVDVKANVRYEEPGDPVPGSDDEEFQFRVKVHAKVKGDEVKGKVDLRSTDLIPDDGRGTPEREGRFKGTVTCVGYVGGKILISGTIDRADGWWLEHGYTAFQVVLEDNDDQDRVDVTPFKITSVHGPDCSGALGSVRPVLKGKVKVKGALSSL